MKIIFIILNFLFYSSFLNAQSLLQDQFLYQTQRLLYDVGNDWNNLTVFRTLTSNSVSGLNMKKINLSSYVDGHMSFISMGKNISLHGFGYFLYNNKYYAYVNPKLVNESYQNGIDSIYFNSNQKSQSGLGYKNSWVNLQLGRGTENWGSGTDINLALSKSSAPYDYFLLGSDYGKVRVKYIYGYLGKIDSSTNRYITARGLEWTNRESLIIGFSETVIYSGKNRSFDIGYLNPISSHLEIELNNRLNITGDGNSNAVWQFHLDYLLNKNIRFSLNYLYDEFVIDQDVELYKEHGRAISGRLAYSPSISNNYLLIFYSTLVYVGTPTFRHSLGTNNFVQNGRPLGWYRGSDSQEVTYGFNYYNKNNLIVNLSMGLLERGEETIINRTFEPYKDYLKGSFPSGEVKRIFNAKIQAFYRWRENYLISTNFYLEKRNQSVKLALNIPIF